MTRLFALLVVTIAAVGLGQPMAGMVPSEVSTLGNHRVHDVAKSGTAEQLAPLLEKDPALLNRKNAWGATPLVLAAKNRDPGPLRALLAAGADVAAADKFGNTALHIAASKRSAEYALQLLEAGASLEAKTNAGLTPLETAKKARANAVVAVIDQWVEKKCQPKQGCEITVPPPEKKPAKAP